MTKISAQMITHSKNEHGTEIGTMVTTFPRYILAELNTHRMFSRNSASSRAIPTKKMLKLVMENPFVPIAWQKDHAGMQGTEYFDYDESFNVLEIKDIMIDRLKKVYEEKDENGNITSIIDPEILQMFENILLQFTGSYTLTEFWLMIRNKVVEAVVLLYCLGVTKQIVNRLMEPFMWHTVIITATDFENFFYLRCPQYQFEPDGKIFRSRKDLITQYCGDDYKLVEEFEAWPEIDWLKINKGQADIHMMALAEAMWDVYKESTSQELKPDQWHIPFEEKDMPFDVVCELLGTKKPTHDEVMLLNVKIATARCARISYTVVGEEGKAPNYENDIKLHDRLAASGHWSPFEHCAKVMTLKDFGENPNSGNFVGFVQYRKMFEGENKK